MSPSCLLLQYVAGKLEEKKRLEYLVVGGGKYYKVRLQEIGWYGVDLVSLAQGPYRNFGFHVRGVS